MFADLNPLLRYLIRTEAKVTYVKMTAEKAARIVSEHIVNGRVCLGSVQLELQKQKVNKLCNMNDCREGSKMEFFRAHVLVCGGTGCTSSNSEKIKKEFEVQLNKNKLDKEVKDCNNRLLWSLCRRTDYGSIS